MNKNENQKQLVSSCILNNADIIAVFADNTLNNVSITGKQVTGQLQLPGIPTIVKSFPKFADRIFLGLSAPDGQHYLHMMNTSSQAISVVAHTGRINAI